MNAHSVEQGTGIPTAERWTVGIPACRSRGYAFEGVKPVRRLLLAVLLQQFQQLEVEGFVAVEVMFDGALEDDFRDGQIIVVV